MKLTFAIKVFMSCKTIDQMSTTLLWIGRILSAEDSRRFLHIAQHVPNFDYAVMQAKSEYIAARF